MKTIFVTGASGSVGSAITSHLVAAGAQVVAGTRHPEKYHGAAQKTVALDYDVPSTFAAVAGAEAVVLVAPPLDMGAAERMIPFIDAALAAGLQQYLLVSAMGIEYAPESSLGKLEAYLAAKTPNYTLLRPTFFMENFSTGFLAPQIQYTEGLSLAAGDGATVFVSTEDIAAIATTTLLQDGHHGKAYALTGPEALNHDQVVSAINKGVGSALTYSAISPEAMTELFAGYGMPASSVEAAVNMYVMVAQGMMSQVSGDF